MDEKYIIAFDIYSNVLVNINDKYNELIQLLNSYNLENINIMFELTYSILSDINRIFSTNNGCIKTDTGIYQLKNNSLIMDDFLVNMLNKNKNIFENIRMIRNKYEHEPFNYKGEIRCLKVNYSLRYKNKISKEKYKIRTDELYKIIKTLNKIFSDLRKEINNTLDINIYFNYLMLKKINKYKYGAIV